MKSILACLILLFLSGEVLSQTGTQSVKLPTVIPPSPDAAALARYSEIPVSESTGVPSISVPIYNLQAGKLSLPISISYHASGIKIRDMASVVGLGWVLNAGGMVSRTVLGRQDENNNAQSVYKTYDDVMNATIAASSNAQKLAVIYELENLKKGYFETESDRYSYNFSNHAGVFRYNRLNNDIQLIPYTPVKIIKNYENNDQSLPQNLYYSIIDEKGDLYIFKSKEVSQQNGLSPASSWVLTKIISNNGADEINLYYSSGEFIPEVSQSCSIIAGNTVTDPNFGDGNREVNFTRSTTTTTHYPQRLDSIVSVNTVIKFLYLNDRQDGRQMRVNKVQVINIKTNVIIKQVLFNQSYFGTAGDHTLRLRLDTVKLTGTYNLPVEKYYFNYNTNFSAPGYYSTPGYLYGGISSNPPNISEDYWGYYGGDGGIPSEFLYFLNASEKNLYGGNRNPNPTLTQAYILKEMHYPTGGKTVFEYESNKSDNPNFYGYPGQTNANNGIVGGLRVKSIKTFADDNSPPIIKTYVYDAVGVYRSIYATLFNYQQQYFYYSSNSTNGNSGGIAYISTKTKNVATSSSVFPLTIFGSSPVIYGKVTEYMGTETNNIGKTESVFDMPLQSTPESQNVLSAPRFISSFQVDRGMPDTKLLSQTTYKNINGVYTRNAKKENFYSYYRNNEFITGLRVDQYLTFVDITGFFASDNPDPFTTEYLNSFSYEETKGYEDVQVLDSTKNYDYSEPLNPVVKKTGFTYENLALLQPTQIAVSSSSDDVFITRYKYPHDFSTVPPYNDMVNIKHNWSPVIEEITYKNSLTTTPLTAIKTNYATWTTLNAIWPQSVFTKIGNNEYEPRVEFLEYSQNGNVRSVRNAGGAKQTYIWGYDEQYPIAAVVNADLADVFHENFEDGNGNSVLNSSRTGNYSRMTSYAKNLSGIHAGNYILSYWLKTGTAWNLVETAVAVSGNSYPINITGQVDDVRFYPSDAQMITYTYDPLIGMTSSTDAKNQITYYEYDGFQRLVNIKDQDGNIIKNFGYHYAEQTTNVVTFSNTIQSGSYTKSCSAGSTGSSAVYTVPAGQYTSTLSQGAADQLAIDDVAANGQAYANSQGTCTINNVTFNLTNTTGVSGFQATFSGLNYYNFPVSGTTTISVPPGVYNISINAINAPTNRRINLTGFTERVAPGTTFQNVNLTAGTTVTLSIGN